MLSMFGRRSNNYRAVFRINPARCNETLKSSLLRVDGICEVRIVEDGCMIVIGKMKPKKMMKYMQKYVDIEAEMLTSEMINPKSGSSSASNIVELDTRGDGGGGGGGGGGADSLLAPFPDSIINGPNVQLSVDPPNSFFGNNWSNFEHQPSNNYSNDWQNTYENFNYPSIPITNEQPNNYQLGQNYNDLPNFVSNNADYYNSHQPQYPSDYYQSQPQADYYQSQPQADYYHQQQNQPEHGNNMQPSTFSSWFGW